MYAGACTQEEVSSTVPIRVQAPIDISDDFEAQVTEFLRPPVPALTNGEWTLIGPVQGKSEQYYRVATNDSLETGSRIFTNWLLFDYTNSQSIPSINIAISVVETLESTLNSYGGAQKFDIYIDNQKVGRIKFIGHPSEHGAYVLMQQAECPNIETVHRETLEGKRISFIGDSGNRFDFDVHGLAGVEKSFNSIYDYIRTFSFSLMRSKIRQSSELLSRFIRKEPTYRNKLRGCTR